MSILIAMFFDFLISNKNIREKTYLGEVNKRMAGAFFSSKLFSDRVKKGLKFFFHLKGRACG